MLADLKYAEAHGPSLQQSSSHLGNNLVATSSSSGQGCSTAVYPSSPIASAHVADISRGESGQSCSPSGQSYLPQGMPFGGTVQGSTEGLDKGASLPFSPAAAPQLTHQHAEAALGTALQRDRNASFGESSAAVGELSTTDPARQYDSEPLSNDCALLLSHQVPKATSASANAAVSKVSKKRAAEVSGAEPGAKQLTVAEGGNARRRSSGGQGTRAADDVLGHIGEAAADVDSDGDSMMADGESDGKGRRRFIRLRKKSITQAVGDLGYHGGEDIQAVASC